MPDYRWSQGVPDYRWSQGEPDYSRSQGAQDYIRSQGVSNYRWPQWVPFENATMGPCYKNYKYNYYWTKYSKLNSNTLLFEQPSIFLRNCSKFCVYGECLLVCALRLVIQGQGQRGRGRGNLLNFFLFFSCS